MKLKSRFFKSFSLIVVVLTLSMIFVGCSALKDSFVEKEVNPKIDVMGIKLYMAEDEFHKAVGVQGEKAMCVNGYEYEYSDKKLNIGFNIDTNEVRRITTKNPKTSIYGLNPGISLDKAYKLIESEGFEKYGDDKYRFRKENIILSIISMKGSDADGIVMEIEP